MARRAARPAGRRRRRRRCSTSSAGTGWADPIRYAVAAPAHAQRPGPVARRRRRARHPTSSFAAWQRRTSSSHPATPRPLPCSARTRTPRCCASGDGETYAERERQAGRLLDQRPRSPSCCSPTRRCSWSPRGALGAGDRLRLRRHRRLGAAPPARARRRRRDLARRAARPTRCSPSNNDHALSDPRVHVYEDDGQSFLRTAPRTYDVIISEPSNPWIAGIGNLFTASSSPPCATRLSPDGVFTFWFHTYEQSDDNVAMIVRTLDAVFPHAVVVRRRRRRQRHRGRLGGADRGRFRRDGTALPTRARRLGAHRHPELSRLSRVPALHC